MTHADIHRSKTHPRAARARTIAATERREDGLRLASLHGAVIVAALAAAAGLLA